MISFWVSPKISTDNEQLLTKATILVCILLLAFVSSIILSAVNYFVALQSDFPLLILAVICFSLLVIFKVTGSLKLSGNLMALALFGIIAQLSLETGGYCSGDTMALFLIPLMSFIIADYRSSLVWVVLTMGWVFYLHSLLDSPDKIAYFRNQTLGFESNYYLVLTLFNIFFFSAFFTIFHFLNKNRGEITRKPSFSGIIPTNASEAPVREM